MDLSQAAKLHKSASTAAQESVSLMLEKRDQSPTSSLNSGEVSSSAEKTEKGELNA